MATAIIPKYNILVNGKHIETEVLGYKTALAHARKYTGNLFERTKVEILTLATGEINEVI